MLSSPKLLKMGLARSLKLGLDDNEPFVVSSVKAARRARLVCGFLLEVMSKEQEWVWEMNLIALLTHFLDYWSNLS